MPSLAKGRRVATAGEDEIRRRWAALDKQQRQAVTRFDDATLVSRIREALQALFEQQVCMEQLGLRLDKNTSSKGLADSPLFVEVFNLPWKVAKSEQMPDVVIMDPDDQPPWMTVREHVLEGNQIFDRFQSVLPNFLGSHTGRTPMPRARWKLLWAAAPSSVASLEQQLSKLMEQALWAMGVDPAFAVQSEAKEITFAPEVPLEDWMIEDRKGDSKQKRKKKKKARTTDLEAYDAICQETADTLALGPIHDVLIVEDSVDNVDLPSPSNVNVLEPEDSSVCKLAESVTPLTPRSVIDESLADDVVLPPSDISVEASTDAMVLQSLPNISAETQVDTVAHPPLGDAGMQEHTPTRSKQPDQAVLQNHYWRPARRAALHWCLPSGVFSRGCWTTPEDDRQLTGKVAAKAVVRNTFIDIDEVATTEPTPVRVSRSLSPSYERQQDDGISVSELSYSYWYR